MTERPPQTESDVVELVRSIDVRAPRELHARVQALVDERAGAVGGRKPVLMRWGLLAGVPAVAVLIAVLAVGLSSGGGGSPLTLKTAVALTLRAPTMGAPGENPHDGTQLKVAVDGVPFPYWDEDFGFKATGERVDRVGGRDVTTVFYTSGHNRWLGYAIVGGTPPPRVEGGLLIHHHGGFFRLNAYGDTRVITWLRGGRLCVVAGHGVSTSTLLKLASWHAVGTSLAA
jgi:hypothetical protein